MKTIRALQMSGAVLGLACSVSWAQGVKPHSQGETILENDDVLVATHVNQYGGWCFSTPRVRNQATANVSFIFKGGPDVDVSDTPEFRALVSSRLWSEIEKRCPQLKSVVAHNFVRGVLISSRDDSELKHGDRLLAADAEKPLYTVFVMKMERGDLMFTPGDLYAPKSLAAFRARQNPAAVAALERERAIAHERTAAEKAIRSAFEPVRLDTTGLHDPSFFDSVFHGKYDPKWEPGYRFRLAFLLFIVGHSIKCPKELPPDAELVAIWQPVYGERTTTWMNGKGFTWTTTVPVQRGKEKIDEVRVAPQFAATIFKYAHDSSVSGLPGGGSGLTLVDVLDPERAATTARVSQETRSDVVRLIDNYTCPSGELKVLAENLLRIVRRQNSVQDEAIYARATDTASGNTTPGPMSERQVIADFVRRQGQRTR
jgi:hypothetical protein